LIFYASLFFQFDSVYGLFLARLFKIKDDSVLDIKPGSSYLLLDIILITGFMLSVGISILLFFAVVFIPVMLSIELKEEEDNNVK